MQSWAAVRGYAKVRPTVFLEPSPTVETMRAIAIDHGAEVRVNPHRYGVLRNPWHAFSDAFTTDEFVILAEDDVLVSDDILEYFTWAAEHYYNERVLAVCAGNQRGACLPTEANTVTRHRQFCALVWGTWVDRWRAVLRDTWDLDYSSGTPEHPQSGWDWNLNLRVIPAFDLDIVSPLASRSTHIGEHMGTHMSAEDFPASVSPTFRADRLPSPYVEVS